MRALAPRAALPPLALKLARCWARAVLAGLRPICGITVEITGRENLPADQPVLLASQHQSAFDTLIWMVELERPSYVMKQELTRIPLFGPLLEPAGMIGVDRKGGAGALRKLIAATLRARDAGRTVIIFPEGTRTPPGVVVPLQPGIAAIAGRLAVPVLPVATDSGQRWGRSVLARRAGPIHIAIGPPIAAGTDRDALLKALRDYWSLQVERGFRPVDNSVEEPSATGLPGAGMHA
jgi:1-acyl-sn-glycerol-3-phosphate acyltransferase